MHSEEAPAAWQPLPTIERLSIDVARRAHRLFTYDRIAQDGRAIVVVVVVDRREALLARSAFATTADPRRVAEHALVGSRLLRCSPYRADSTHRESRIEALVGPTATAAPSAYERLRRSAPPLSA